MKTPGRILIILIAAFGVIGAAYALSQTTAVSALVGQPQGPGEAEDRPAFPDQASGESSPSSETVAPPAGGPEGGLVGGPEGRGGLWETVGRNLLIMAALIAAVQVVWSIGRRMTRKKPLTPGRYT
jgi:hypothetical protein